MPDTKNTQTVQAPCGCTLTCDWSRGERGIWCGCNPPRQWTVKRSEKLVVTYTVEKETTPTS